MFSAGIERGNSSLIREKCESQNGCYTKTKHAKFSEQRTFLTTWYASMWPSNILVMSIACN